MIGDRAKPLRDALRCAAFEESYLTYEERDMAFKLWLRAGDYMLEMIIHRMEQAAK